MNDPRIPYSVLAAYYNTVMSHVNYKRWAKYVLRILKKMGVKKGRVIDLSFGTGLFAAHFSRNRFTTFGADRSIDMLRQYDGRNTNPGWRLLAGDITRTAFKDETADVLLFLYDSTNYLNTRYRLRRAFSEVYRVLRPGGIFIFDIVTTRLCQTYFADHRESVMVGDAEIVRESVFDARKSLQYNYFTVCAGGKKYRETHIQRIYDISVVIETAEQANLAIMACYDGLGFDGPSPESERIHVVCKKND